MTAFATEPVPPRVGRKHDKRGNEPKAFSSLCAALGLRPERAAAALGLPLREWAGVLSGNLRLVEDGWRGDWMRGVWAHAAAVLSDAATGAGAVGARPAPPAPTRTA